MRKRVVNERGQRYVETKRKTQAWKRDNAKSEGGDNKNEQGRTA